jgi:hypothetical protein
VVVGFLMGLLLDANVGRKTQKKDTDMPITELNYQFTICRTIVTT